MHAIITQLFNSLNENQRVITSNQRLATHISHMHTQMHQKNGLSTCWLTPRIISLQHWLVECWQELHLCGVTQANKLLNATQKKALFYYFSNCLHTDYPLLDVSETSQRAQEVWDIIQKWQIPLEVLMEDQGDIQNLCYMVIQSYHNHCEQNSYLDDSQLIGWLSKQALQYLEHPRQLILLGFDDIPTQLKALFDVFSTYCEIRQIDKSLPSPSLHQGQLIASCDAVHDIEQLAEWAKCLYDDNPLQSIGCVVPQLSQHYRSVQQIFGQVFHRYIGPFQASRDTPYNISYGRALGDYPLIAYALQSLSLHQGKHHFETLSHWLRSPFLIGADQEYLARCDLDIRLRKQGDVNLSLSTVAAHIKKMNCPHLQRALQTYQALLDKQPTRGKPSEFASYFQSLLHTLGWPGSRNLTSAEYQLYQKWQQLLLEFTNLDHFIPILNKQQASSCLKYLAMQTLFQPQNQSKAIQVLGVLEAAALPFDLLRICHLDDKSWPIVPSNRSLIPTWIQQTYHLPHSSPQRTLAFYKRLTQRFKVNAPQVIFTYPMYHEEQLLQPSPLLGLTANQEQKRGDSLFKLNSNLRNMFEVIHDEKGPEILEEDRVGGSYALQQQANCPFQAFAHFRLSASALPEINYFITPVQRGQLVHATLQQLWERIGSHRNLCEAHQSGLLTEWIESSVAFSLVQFKKCYPRKCSTIIDQITRQHLIMQIKRWCELEIKRMPFTLVATEKKRCYSIAGLSIKLCIDRVDRLEDGSLVIIDYKTSAYFSLKSWFGDPLEQPQLPLYALSYATGKSISAISIAELTSNTMQFKGLQRYQGILPGNKSLEQLKYTYNSMVSWGDLLHQWQEKIQQLAIAFRQGYAAVAPLCGQSCQYCDLALLCRIGRSSSL